MSEEFDKEAEREKLREKYEKDAEKRSATQRMSELLLGGATMTDQHCERCGDPLFREGGEAFCPTCTNEEQATQQADATDTQATPTDAAPDQPSQQPAEQSPAGAVGSNAGNGTGEAESLAQLPDNAEVVARADDAEPERRTAQQPSQSQPSQPQQRRQSQPEHTQPPAGGDGADPGAELRRAVAETARKANAATDPRTAKSWLEASKEAAEALAALER